MLTVVRAVAPLFSPRVGSHAQVLLVGAILAPAQCTVAAARRVTGLTPVRQFHRYHRVLSRAAWSGLGAGRVLLELLVAAFVPTGPLLFGIDETLERRRGKRIAATGLDRDPVRSSCRQCPCPGCSSATPTGHSPPRRCSAPILPSPRTRSSPGSSSAGRWRSPVRTPDATSGWRHSGLETPRQWLEAAIGRTTPILLELFSLVTLLAHRQMAAPAEAVRQAAWYRTPQPTFADALALVRREVWRHQAFHPSPRPHVPVQWSKSPVRLSIA